MIKVKIKGDKEEYTLISITSETQFIKIIGGQVVAVAYLYCRNCEIIKVNADDLESKVK